MFSFAFNTLILASFSLIEAPLRYIFWYGVSNTRVTLEMNIQLKNQENITLGC